MSLKLNINKTEKIILTVIAFGLILLFFTPNVTWVLKQFGINIGSNAVNSIIDYIANGGTLVQAFAVVAGVTLPAWVGALVASAGITAA